jgi:hypothetical protein
MKWINLEDKKPKPCVDILFTDGKKIYKGWLETYEPGEDLYFFTYEKESRNSYFHIFMEGITHWMELPKLPKIKNA